MITKRLNEEFDCTSNNLQTNIVKITFNIPVIDRLLIFYLPSTPEKHLLPVFLHCTVPEGKSLCIHTCTDGRMMRIIAHVPDTQNDNFPNM